MLPTEIRTRRLVLRPFAPDDVDDVFHYAQDQEWARYLSLPQPYLREHAVDFVQKQRNLDRAKTPVWAIEREQVVIGGIGLDLDVRHRRAVLGYSIARPAWGRGLMTEAAGAVIDAAFGSCPDLNKVCAAANPENRGSTRVMEKVGMAREALVRRHIVHRGQLVDDVWYAILREEWQKP